ncbi:hypothetical protein HPB47_003687, partial [Ixodes persulcatus]
ILCPESDSLVRDEFDGLNWLPPTELQMRVPLSRAMAAWATGKADGRVAAPLNGHLSLASGAGGSRHQLYHERWRVSGRRVVAESPARVRGAEPWTGLTAERHGSLEDGGQLRDRCSVIPEDDAPSGEKMPDLVVMKSPWTVIDVPYEQTARDRARPAPHHTDGHDCRANTRGCGSGGNANEGRIAVPAGRSFLGFVEETFPALPGGQSRSRVEKLGDGVGGATFFGRLARWGSSWQCCCSPRSKLLRGRCVSERRCFSFKYNRLQHIHSRGSAHQDAL